jgi:hypothetical protein
MKEKVHCYYVDKCCCKVEKINHKKWQREGENLKKEKVIFMK